MKTWVRRGSDPAHREGDIIVWVKTDDGKWFILTNGGALKEHSIVGYEGMTHDWEPDAECFLTLGSDR